MVLEYLQGQWLQQIPGRNGDKIAAPPGLGSLLATTRLPSSSFPCCMPQPVSSTGQNAAGAHRAQPQVTRAMQHCMSAVPAPATAVVLTTTETSDNLAVINKQNSKQGGPWLTRIFCGHWFEILYYQNVLWKHDTTQVSSWRWSIRQTSWRGLYLFFKLIQDFWPKKSCHLFTKKNSCPVNRFSLNFTLQWNNSFSPWIRHFIYQNIEHFSLD